MLLHVTGRHTWAVGNGGAGRCAHDDTHEDEDKELIETGSVALKELRKIVWDVNFLRKIPYFFIFLVSKC